MDKFKRKIIVSVLVIVIAVFAILQYQKILYQTKVFNFVKDYIEFLAGFEKAAANMINFNYSQLSDPQQQVHAVHEYIQAVSATDYKLKEALKHLQPYINDKDKSIKQIAERMTNSINDLIMYQEKTINLNNNSNSFEVNNLIGKSNAALEISGGYLDANSVDILKMVFPNISSKLTRSNLNKNQLKQILSEVDNYFGDDLEKIDYKGKKVEDFSMKMNKWLWLPLFIRLTSETALLQYK